MFGIVCSHGFTLSEMRLLTLRWHGMVMTVPWRVSAGVCKADSVPSRKKADLRRSVAVQVLPWWCKLGTLLLELKISGFKCWCVSGILLQCKCTRMWSISCVCADWHKQWSHHCASAMHYLCQQSYLTFFSLCVYIETIFLQPEYNCIIFLCFACQTDCFCMQQVMTKEIISFSLKT